MDFQIEPLQNPNIVEPQPPMQLPTPSPKRSVLDLIKKIGIKYVIWGLALILVVALVSFFLGRGSFRENDVELKIEGPSEITGGELVTYKLTYKNSNAVSLSDVKLNILYPIDSIVAKDGNISDLTTENFDIGTIGSNEMGEKELTVYLVGDRGNIKTLKAALTYKAGNLSSVFQKEAALAATITSLAVPITLVATPTVISGQNTSYLIDYRNQSNQDLENLRFVVKYPAGFVSVKFSPQPSVRNSGQDLWDVAKLKLGDGSRITIEGVLNGNERETKTISVILQKKITTPDGDVYLDFEKSEASSVISTPLLSLDLKINGLSDYVAHIGDTLRYKIRFQNNNGVDITGLSLSARLEGGMYDFATVKSDGFFDGRSNTIFWNASALPMLNLLPRNQSGTVEFEVRLKDSFSGGTGARDSFVKITAHLETPNVPSELDLDKLTANSELVTRISTAPTFDQKLLVNDSVFGSSGQFPPKVNRKSAFTVSWGLVNPSNDLSKAKVMATLAPGVSWENRKRSNGTGIEPTYDSRLNMVSWDLGTLPAGIGVNFSKYESYFQISFTPSVNQVGQSAPLLKNIKFEGVDTFTKEKILRTLPDIDTNNVSDSNESGTIQQ
ncbi:MAG: hypothetical protein HYX20_01290 [Candidatus Yanofskybacteria bacterium]|nr:hypothetical protein [Candidatus Yanofskybacteria bacterium]